MTWPWQGRARTEAELLAEVERAVRQVTGSESNRGGPPFSADLFLGAQLGLSSLAVARLAGLLQQRLGRKGLPFQKLLVAADGTVSRDIRVTDLVAFLDRELRAP